MKGPRSPRRSFWLAAAWLTLAGGASAQAPPQGDLMIGVTWASYHSQLLHAAPLGGGDQWSQIWSGSRIAPTLGAGVSVPMASFLFLRAEALLVRKGLTSSDVVLDDIYLELPVLLRIEMPWKDQIRLRATAGIAPALEVRCSAKVAPPVAAGTEGRGLQPADCQDFRSESGDIGNVFGVGFGPVRVAGLAIMPELRLVLGGADLLSGRPREKARHQTFSLLLAVSR